MKAPCYITNKLKGRILVLLIFWFQISAIAILVWRIKLTKLGSRRGNTNGKQHHKPGHDPSVWSSLQGILKSWEVCAFIRPLIIITLGTSDIRLNSAYSLEATGLTLSCENYRVGLHWPIPVISHYWITVHPFSSTLLANCWKCYPSSTLLDFILYF